MQTWTKALLATAFTATIAVTLGCDSSSSSGSDDWYDDLYDDLYDDDIWHEDPPPNEPLPPPNYTHDLMQYGPHWGPYGPATNVLSLGNDDPDLLLELLIGGEFDKIATCQIESTVIQAMMDGAYFYEQIAEHGPASEFFTEQAASISKGTRQAGRFYAALLRLNHAIAFYPKYLAIAEAPWEAHKALYSDFREVFWPDCIQSIPTACFEPSYKFIDYQGRCAQGRLKLSTLPGYEMLRETYPEIENQTGLRLE